MDFQNRSQSCWCFVLIENPGPYMANSHTVEHGKTPFANCVVFEDLADEEWRVLLLTLSPSLAVAFTRQSRKSSQPANKNGHLRNKYLQPE